MAAKSFLLLVVLTLLVSLVVYVGSSDDHENQDLVDLVAADDHDNQDFVDLDAAETDASGVAGSEFIATSEWQELLPGQEVPRGLHVRLNMETGKREAKLVDPHEQEVEVSMSSVVVDHDVDDAMVTVSTDISGDIVANEFGNDELAVTTEILTGDDFGDEPDAARRRVAEDDTAEPNWNHEKIFDVLQSLPEPPQVEGMDIHEAHEKLSPADFRKQIVTLWKKRQAELKEALESLQDDAKYLGKLLEQFKEAEQTGDTEGQLSVLEVLEWEVQDLDKTHVFNFIGGFSIIAEYLNSTNLPVRAKAAWVIGSAAKNYNDGQEWAIDAGVMPKLIASLTLEVTGDVNAVNDILEVKKKAIYALSSLSRSNERGQRLFLLNHGPEILSGLFNDSHPTKLQLKVLLFVYDLLAEAAEIKLRSGEQSSALMALEEVFQSAEWCERFSMTFVKMAPFLARREVIELIDAIRHQLPACQEVHQASGIKTVVETLAESFAQDEELDEEEKNELALFFEDFLSSV